MRKEQARPNRTPRPARSAALRLAGVLRRNRRALLLTTALQATVVLVLAQPARAQLSPNAAPQGGVVVGGAASIARSASATTITQSSQRAAIDWQSFNVGARQSVDFQQPNAAAVALNRVTGPNPSQIAGQINANGQVILENQDGITFLKGAQVNTAGFMATASGISPGNFMAGRMVFDQPAHPGARIVNQGHITVTQAGIAALVAPQVANSGVITARLGHVILAGASTWTLDLYGDGLVSIDVTGAVRQTAQGPALVTNTGTILASGGEITLTARAAAGLVQQLIAAGGTISAPSVAGHSGQVVLNGVGGSIVVAGALLAEGTAPGTKGGAIEVAAQGGDVALAAGARLNASGVAGGGTVAVGTDLARAAGGPAVTPSVLSRDVTVAPGASISADATGAGDGGRVTVLAEDQTVMGGAISAQGGPAGGDGGFVEVSGRVLGFDGQVALGAPHGAAGTLLLDPGTLDIVPGISGSAGADVTLGELGSIGFGTDGTIATDSVSAGAIDAIGSNAAVVLQATTLLDVQSGVSIAISHDLTMQSGGSLIVENNVTLASGGVLSLGAGISSNLGTQTLAAALSLGAGTNITSGNPTQAGGITLGSNDVLNGGSVILVSGTSGGIGLGSALVSASSVIDLSTAGGDVTQDPGGRLIAATLQSSTGIAGGATLAGTANAIAALSGFSVGGQLSLNDGEGLSIAGPVSLGSASLTGPALTVNAALAVGNALAFGISGDVTEGGSGSVAAGALTGNVGGNLLLTGGGNQVASLSNIAVGTSLALTDARAVSLAGTIRAPTLVVTATPNQVTVENGTQVITGGIARPLGANVSDTYPVPGSGLGGAYFSDFQLIGGMTVTGINGGPSIVRIDAYQGGSINLGSGGAGLVGPTTWLILDLLGPSTLGTVVGTVNIGALDMLYAPGAAGGLASLFGTVGGVPGPAAAGIAFIHPTPDPRFQLNSCVIGTVSCIVLPIEVLPEGNPLSEFLIGLSEFSIGALFLGDDSDDLFLPLVSRRDY